MRSHLDQTSRILRSRKNTTVPCGHKSLQYINSINQVHNCGKKRQQEMAGGQQHGALTHMVCGIISLLHNMYDVCVPVAASGGKAAVGLRGGAGD